MKLYIAVLDEFPDYMVPTLVAHSVLAAHLQFTTNFNGEFAYPSYMDWLKNSFKKCVVRVNQREFEKIKTLSNDVHIGYEKNTLDGRGSCIVVCPYRDDEPLPNVLKFAKLWKPKES